MSLICVGLHAVILSSYIVILVDENVQNGVENEVKNEKNINKHGEK